MYSFHLFKRLPADVRIDELNEHGISLDLARADGLAEKVLFAYNNFYVELVVERYTDAIITLTCFKSGKRLEPYLPQVDIGEITFLLSTNK